MITVTHLEDKGIYHFDLPYGSWEVNGQRVEKNYGSNQPMTTAKPPVIKKINTQRKLKHYLNDNAIISVEDYSYQLAHLQSPGSYDEDSCDYVFNNLDDEYAYKKFIRAHQGVYETITTYEDEELNIIHAMLESESEYIVPLFSFDSSKADLVKFYKNKLELDSTIQWAKENCCILDIPTHGHLRFAKLNGNYVFDDSFDGKYGILTITPDQAKEELKKVPARVITKLRSSVLPFKNINVTIAKVIDDLKSIKDDCVKHMHARTPSRSTAFNRVRVKIDKLIELIESQV